MSTLRGAGVAADGRKVGRVVAVLAAAGLIVSAAIIFVAELHKNAQITELRSHGVNVEVTVTRCVGLLGGSGSNAAGYACRGTYEFGAKTYDEAIPGNVRRAPGSTVAGVISPSDPALVSTVAAVRAAEASWRVFVLPAVLALLGLLALVAFATRRSRDGGDPRPAPGVSRIGPRVGQIGGV